MISLFFISVLSSQCYPCPQQSSYHLHWPQSVWHLPLKRTVYKIPSDIRLTATRATPLPPSEVDPQPRIAGEPITLWWKIRRNVCNISKHNNKQKIGPVAMMTRKKTRMIVVKKLFIFKKENLDHQYQCQILIRFIKKQRYLCVKIYMSNYQGYTVFENHRKKSHSTWFILASFWKPEACGQTVLPDMSVFIGHKIGGKCQNSNAHFE